MPLGSRKKTVEIDFIADTAKATRGIKDVGDTAEKQGSRFQTMGAKAKLGFAAAAVGIGATINFLKDAAVAAAEDEAAQADLARQLEASTQATDDQIAATEEFIKQTALATGVADDELRPALETLTRATGDLEEAQGLLGTAMDIAAATGKPLQAVVDAIAKAAQNGSTGGLARLGLKIRDVNGEMLTLDEIMQNAASTMGGAMAVQAETASGKMARLNVTLEEAREELGGALLPAIEGLIPILMDLIRPLSLAINEVNQWTGAIDDTQAAIREWEILMGTQADTAAAAIQIWQSGGIEWGNLLDELKLGPAELMKLNSATDDYLLTLGVTNDTLPEFRENTQKATRAVFDARGEQTKQVGSLQAMEGATDDAAEAQAGLTQEVLTYTETLQKNADPVFNAVDAVNDLKDAQITLAEKQADTSSTAADVAEAQLDVAEAILGAQGAMDKLNPGQLNAAIGSISTALGISETAVRELLEQLGVLDGTTVTAYINIQERFRTIIERSRPGGVQEHVGGVVPGAFPGQEVWVQARAGERYGSAAGSPAQANGNSNGQMIHNVINVDGRKLFEEVVLPQMARYNRRNGTVL